MSDPAVALQETGRVLRPGRAMALGSLRFTSEHRPAAGFPRVLWRDEPTLDNP